MLAMPSITIFYLAQSFGEEQESTWSEWISWSSCSKTCGDGTQTRLRACQGLTFDSCPGLSVEIDTCNDGECPLWSEWSDWGACSAKCDGGVQSRTRQCQNGEDEDCPGSSSDEQLCNKQSCNPGMVYWKDQKGFSSSAWKEVRSEFLPAGETFFDQCASYCLSYRNDEGERSCLVAQTFSTIYFNSPEDSTHVCYFSEGTHYRSTKPWRSERVDHVITGTFGVVMKEYKRLSKWPAFFMGQDPHGTAGGSVLEIEGLCEKANTDFGIVNFKNTGATEFVTLNEKNIIRDPTTTDCAAKCFETAGCSTFFADDNGCNYVIGFTSNAINNEKVTNSGMLHDVCLTNAFQSTLTKVSEFYCLLSLPDEIQNAADSIIESNIANTDSPLRVWSFETKTDNPMITTSQYVSVTIPKGVKRQYNPIVFSIETHVRVGQNPSSRKRRSADKKPEWTLVSELTDKTIQKSIQKAKKEAFQQRSVMSRTEDILAEINAIEQQAVNFILEGEMELPAGVEVAATGPVETVQFVQTAADGSIAADCSSGSCQCSVGFVDNGSGCVEEVLSTQASTTTLATTLTTTKAPSTKSSTTTAAPDLVRDWIPSLVEKMQIIFENDRPRKLRSQLLKKWQKLGDKFVQKYDAIARNGCDFANTYEDDSVDFKSVDRCKVRFKLSNISHFL